MAEDEIIGPPRIWLFQTLAALGDLEFQRATWLDPEMQNPHFTYVEFVECFYDTGAGDWRVLQKTAPDAPFSWLFGAGRINEAERELLWGVHLALSADEQPDDYDHAAILSSPTWLEVVRVASNAVAQLKISIKDPAELAVLENTLPTASAKRWPQIYGVFDDQSE